MFALYTYVFLHFAHLLFVMLVVWYTFHFKFYNLHYFWFLFLWFLLFFSLKLAGRFENTTGNTMCKNCPANFISVNTSSTKCVACTTGKQSKIGSTKCESCAAGQFGDGCKSCDAGKFRKVDDAANLCKSCSKGLYQNEKSQASW